MAGLTAWMFLVDAHSDCHLSRSELAAFLLFSMENLGAKQRSIFAQSESTG